MLAPYGLLAFELDGAADGGQSGTYLELGVGPSFPLMPNGPTLTIPVKLGLSVNDYYEGPTGDTTFGFFDIGALISVPIRGIPAGYGAWNFHAGADLLLFGDTTKAFNGGDGRAASAAAGRSSTAAAAASVKLKQAPAPGVPVALTVPPWRSTMRCTMLKPMPVPAYWSRACSRLNGLNNCVARAGSKPVPLSLTLTRTRPSAHGSWCTWTLGGCASRVNLAALPSRLASTIFNAAGLAISGAPLAMSHCTGAARSIAGSSASTSCAIVSRATVCCGIGWIVESAISFNS
jgi:hypothetical protein